MNYRTGAATLCARCQTPMDPSRALFDKGGHVVCPGCAAAGTIAETEGRAMASFILHAAAVTICGLAGLQFSVLALVALVAGAVWLKRVAGNSDYQRRLGNRYVPSLVCVVIGMATGALGILLTIASIVLA